MPTPDEEAQLEQTKMSFGEHLEELRRALFKSILALLAGFVVGLFIGMPLVDYIQEPLRRALLEPRRDGRPGRPVDRVRLAAADL